MHRATLDAAPIETRTQRCCSAAVSFVLSGTSATTRNAPFSESLLPAFAPSMPHPCVVQRVAEEFTLAVLAGVSIRLVPSDVRETVPSGGTAISPFLKTNARIAPHPSGSVEFREVEAEERKFRACFFASAEDQPEQCFHGYGFSNPRAMPPAIAGEKKPGHC